MFFCLLVLLTSPPLEIRVHKFLTWSLSISLSACFLHFLPKGQKWGAGTGWQWGGSREAAGPPAQQRLARRSQPAAGRGRLGGLGAHPGARLPAGRAPRWSGCRSRRRSHWEDAEAGAPRGGKVRALGRTPACSDLFAKPTRGGQWGQVSSPEAHRPTSAATYAPVRPGAPTPPHIQHPLSPSQRKGANVGIARGRKARALGILPSRGSLCKPRLTSRPHPQPPIPHSLSSSRQQGRRRSQR